LKRIMVYHQHPCPKTCFARKWNSSKFKIIYLQSKLFIWANKFKRYLLNTLTMSFLPQLQYTSSTRGHVISINASTNWNLPATRYLLAYYILKVCHLAHQLRYYRQSLFRCFYLRNTKKYIKQSTLTKLQDIMWHC
jgi:hypothetical protein